MSLYNPETLLRGARRTFRIFYEAATVIDAGLMDALVLAHAGLRIGMAAPREGVPPEIRSELERKTNTAEFIFADLRRCVQECETFLALPLVAREQIERDLFQLSAPTEAA